MKLTFAAVAFALLAAPVFAETMADPAKMMCKDLMAMDMTGMMAAGTAIKGAMKDDAAMMAMSDEEVMKAAEEACKIHPDGTVSDAMNTDPAKMMCKDLMAMDMTGMMAAGAAIKGSMKDDAAMQAMTDEDVMKGAEAACKMHPDGMVSDAMKMKM